MNNNITNTTTASNNTPTPPPILQQARMVAGQRRAPAAAPPVSNLARSLSSRRIPTSSSTEVENIMNSVVSKNSEYQYDNENVKLLLWICKTNNDAATLLKTEFRTEMQQVDSSTGTEKQKEAKRRLVCKKWLKAVKRGGNNSPIILKQMNFGVFSEYLTSRKSKNSTYLSKSTYDGIRSALAHLYRRSGETMCDIMQKDLKQFMGGIKRTVVREKRATGQSLDEGKKPMTFAVYKKMCEILYKGKDDEYTFAHAFLTLEWNLMARSDNVKHCHLNHVKWSADSLQFFFTHSKGNQTGENSEIPWHVYSNPSDPFVCPVLALGKYLFSQASLLHEGAKLFPGEYQYDRFLKVFHKVIRENAEDFRALGVNPGDLGSHSTRKGAITLATTGCTVSPPMASVCLRACWSMGPVKDRYIHYEKAGDQFVGRTVTGISAMIKEFAVSPAYFDFEGSEQNNDDTVNNILKNNLVNGKNMGASTFLMMKSLLAAICYHYDHLATNLDARNKLRSSPIFIVISQSKSLRDCATVKYPWNKDAQTPIFTGIPPHVMLLAEMEEMKLLLQKQKDEILDGIREELTKRHVGGDTYQSSVILDQVNELHEKMMNALDKSSTSTTLNVNQGSDVLNIGVEHSTAAHNSSLGTTAASNENTRGTSSTTNERNPGDPPRFLAISWENCENGNINLLPNNYDFPSIPFSNLTTMWYCGNVEENIVPFHMLRASHVKHLKHGKQKLSNMKRVINWIHDAARKVGKPELILADSRRWTVAKSVALYEAVAPLFKFPALGLSKTRRFETITWKTIYNILTDRKGKLLDFPNQTV